MRRSARVALELFHRQGFEETSVEDIAATVGVDPRTIFRYFPSKNDIVWGDFDWVIGRLRHHLDEGDDTCRCPTPYAERRSSPTTIRRSSYRACGSG